MANLSSPNRALCVPAPHSHKSEKSQWSLLSHWRRLLRRFAFLVDKVSSLSATEAFFIWWILLFVETTCLLSYIIPNVRIEPNIDFLCKSDTKITPSGFVGGSKLQTRYAAAWIGIFRVCHFAGSNDAKLCARFVGCHSATLLRQLFCALGSKQQQHSVQERQVCCRFWKCGN